MKGEIEVTGWAEDRALPDRAVIEVTTDASGKSSATAYRSALAGAARVDAVLENHAAAIERTQVANVSIRETSVYRDGEHIPTGWSASRRSKVEVIDFDALTPLVADLAQAGATIDGPRWEVDATNAVHDAVRAAAAGDARRRAEAYSSGLGIGVGGVRRVIEPGSRATVTAYSDHPMALASMSDEMAIEPADLQVTATVTVIFAVGDA